MNFFCAEQPDVGCCGLCTTSGHVDVRTVCRTCCTALLLCGSKFNRSAVWCGDLGGHAGGPAAEGEMDSIFFNLPQEFCLLTFLSPIGFVWLPVAAVQHRAYAFE